MTERSSEHATFTIERVYEGFAPARVFKAWADPAVKAQWFVGPGDWKERVREADFRVGGRERLVGVWPSGRTTDFDAVYHDIVPDQRIVYSYVMHSNEKKVSVSLATLEFRPERNGTRLVFTEQAAFLDGFEDGGGRQRGTLEQLERVESVLKTLR